MEYQEYIDKYLTIFENNFSTKTKKKDRIPMEKCHEMVGDLNTMIDRYFLEDGDKASNIAIERYIPLLNLMLNIDKNNAQDYEKYLYTAYKIASRTSLEHYFIFREWGEKKEDKFFAPRYNIMKGYVHYLQEITENPNFKMLIVMMPSGYGKSYPEKVSEAWAFGRNSSETVLSLCSNDDVVKGGSRTVRDEMKSEWFGEVFPNMKFVEEDKKNYFIKETDGNWKLKDCKLGSSYIASTVNSNVVGIRASQRIHIDDLYADYKEAMVQSLNEYYYNKFTTVWRKRFVQNKTPKIVVSGTLWASGDFISRLVNEVTEVEPFAPHVKYPYTYINKDESIAIIRVPALDYKTGRSTCPELRTTREIEEEKRRIPEYIFETNFQQKPTDPESMMFSYGKLRTYEKLPPKQYEGTYAVIDANRKTGKDFFSMPILQREDDENGIDNYYLVDCIYTQTATKDLYEQICQKIQEHHINHLVIESNVSGELAQNLDRILTMNGISYCEITEKYNTAIKEVRITDQSHLILKRLIFPKQNNISIQTDIGLFMNGVTTYNTNGRNEHDDACFDGETLIATQFGYKKIKDIKIGDKVITPIGLRKVLECGITGYKETIDKFGLKITPNHKVYDKKENKFIPIDRFTLYANCDILSLKGMIKWKIKLWNLMGKHIKETQRADIILSTQQEMLIENTPNNYTLQCGNTIMEKFLKDIIYTIKTKTLTITTFLIWSVFLLGNICRNTLKNFGKMKKILKKEEKECKGIANNKINVESGIEVMKEENGIENTLKNQFLNTNLKKKEYANIVEKNILQKQNNQNIVHQNANKKVGIYQRQKSALFVGKNFTQQVTSQKLARENAKLNNKLRPVYNIKVEGIGCYYANNILVSNCDSLAMMTREFIDRPNTSSKISIFKRPF